MQVNNIRVMHLLNSDKFSGAENVVIQIIRQSKRIYGMESMYVSIDGSIRERLKKEDIKFKGTKNNSIFEIYKIVKEYKPDIIHAHDFTASALAAIVAPRYVRIISHLHNNPPWIKKVTLKSLAYFMIIHRLSKILLVSNAIVQEYIFKNYIKDKAIVLGNPMSLQLIAQRATNKDAKITICSYIVFLGRLSLQKNPRRFIEIFEKLKKKNLNIKAYMIGNGELMQKCKDLIAEKRLENEIYLTGFLQNPYELLSKAVVLCAPSLWEGFGLMAFEALALGVPVLASPVGGLPGIVDNTCGKLCVTDDEFLCEITALVSDPNYRRMKSEGAIKKAKAMDNYDEYMSYLHGIYVNL